MHYCSHWNLMLGEFWKFLEVNDSVGCPHSLLELLSVLLVVVVSDVRPTPALHGRLQALVSMATSTATLSPLPGAPDVDAGWWFRHFFQPIFDEKSPIDYCSSDTMHSDMQWLAFLWGVYSKHLYASHIQPLETRMSQKRTMEMRLPMLHLAFWPPVSRRPCYQKAALRSNPGITCDGWWKPGVRTQGTLPRRMQAV